MTTKTTFDLMVDKKKVVHVVIVVVIKKHIIVVYFFCFAILSWFLFTKSFQPRYFTSLSGLPACMK